MFGVLICGLWNPTSLHPKSSTTISKICKGAATAGRTDMMSMKAKTSKHLEFIFSLLVILLLLILLIVVLLKLLKICVHQLTRTEQYWSDILNWMQPMRVSHLSCVLTIFQRKRANILENITWSTEYGKKLCCLSRILANGCKIWCSHICVLRLDSTMNLLSSSMEILRIIW